METMTKPKSPAKEKNLIQLASELGTVLSQYIADDEKNGRLSPAVVQALKEAGFYKLFLPGSLGGVEADPLTVAKVVEEVARHNTAAGWSLMVANTTLTMASRLPEKGIKKFLVVTRMFLLRVLFIHQ